MSMSQDKSEGRTASGMIGGSLHQPKSSPVRTIKQGSQNQLEVIQNLILDGDLFINPTGSKIDLSFLLKAATPLR
jgi:hypothetical protein